MFILAEASPMLFHNINAGNLLDLTSRQVGGISKTMWFSFFLKIYDISDSNIFQNTPFGTLRFEILYQNVPNLFRINAVNGQVSVGNALSSATFDEYQVNI